MIDSSLRRLFGLPRRRSGSWVERQWVPMHDGTRLATLHLWPSGAEGRVPSVLVRTPYDAQKSLAAWFPWARLIAESGYHVLVQDVRGRYASEGLFTPFESEARDGADTLEWLTDQPWCAGGVGLLGWSYLAYCAQLALAEAPDRIDALVVAIGSGDLYRLFHPGGAFALWVALEWATGVGERERVPRRRIDLERGLAFRPAREADRVALRTIECYRDWIDHPNDDAYWAALRPAPIAKAPPTLMLAGWYDFFLRAQLADYARSSQSARVESSPQPRLVIGPWSHGLPARMGWWRSPLQAVLLREAIAHFDWHLKGEPAHGTPANVRFFVAGEEHWRDAEKWPPVGGQIRALYLRSDGRLDAHPPASEEEPDRYRHDPDQPVPTRGGPLFGIKSGIRDQRALLRRADVAAYETAALREDLLVIGSIRVVLHVTSAAESMDFIARLLDVEPAGRALNVCDGVLRHRAAHELDGSEQTRPLATAGIIELEIDLGACAWRFGADHRVGLLIASSNWPRFDLDAEVSEQTIFHDDLHPSRLIFSAL